MVNYASAFFRVVTSFFTTIGKRQRIEKGSGCANKIFSVMCYDKKQTTKKK